jgi:hemerythrin
MQGVVKLSVQGQSIAEKLIAELQADDASMDKLITFLVKWIAPFLLETDQSAPVLSMDGSLSGSLSIHP